MARPPKDKVTALVEAFRQLQPQDQRRFRIEVEMRPHELRIWDATRALLETTAGSIPITGLKDGDITVSLPAAGPPPSRRGRKPGSKNKPPDPQPTA